MAGSFETTHSRNASSASGCRNSGARLSHGTTISFSGGPLNGTGAGQTIGIAAAYSDPNITADLAAFDKQYGLPAPPSFTVDNLGATTTDAGWALETSLDVEWAHAIAPQANILLV